MSSSSSDSISESLHKSRLLDQFLDQRSQTHLVLQGLVLNKTCVTFATAKSWHFGGRYFQFLPPTNPEKYGFWINPGQVVLVKDGRG